MVILLSFSSVRFFSPRFVFVGFGGLVAVGGEDFGGIVSLLCGPALYPSIKLRKESGWPARL